MILNLSHRPHRRPPPPSRASLWESNFLLIQQFQDREGHLRVPKQHVEDGRKLGNWSCMQRTQKRKGTLPSERNRRLNEIGFIFNAQQATSETNFDRNFDLLLAFQEREGHVRVPQKHQESTNDNLGVWLGTQRLRRRKGLLELDRQKWLEVAGVTF
jgi:hypothetical protein